MCVLMYTIPSIARGHLTITNIEVDTSVVSFQDYCVRMVLGCYRYFSKYNSEEDLQDPNFSWFGAPKWTKFHSFRTSKNFMGNLLGHIRSGCVATNSQGCWPGKFAKQSGQVSIIFDTASTAIRQWKYAFLPSSSEVLDKHYEAKHELLRSLPYHQTEIAGRTSAADVKLVNHSNELRWFACIEMRVLEGFALRHRTGKKRSSANSVKRSR